ncbi:methylmalonyl-CoA mutase [Synergistales bacterium]|nr:methylmalonyl-CoA mutase [Synergistales bacterium]
MGDLKNNLPTPPSVDFSEFKEATYDEWKEAAVAALKGASFDKSMFTQTYEGIRLEPIYTRESLKNIPEAKTLPGKYPSLRGGHASGYVKSPWEVAQVCDDRTPSAANETIKHDLAKGATTITIRLSDSTPDESRGVSVSSPEDAKCLLDGIDTAKYPFHIFAGASAKPLIDFIAPLGDLKGCIGADPIGSYLLFGKLPRALDKLFDEAGDTINFAEAKAPSLRTLLFKGDVYHNAGANAVQEVAFVMASAIELAQAMSARSIDIEKFAKHIRFEFSVGSNFFMEIAKIRAARFVWSRIAESFGGGTESEKCEIFATTSFFTKTVYDPYVNLLRNTTEAFSAVLGGVDGLTVVPFDEAVRCGDEFSRRVARNSQIMLQNEYHLLQPIDPAGGSWYLESLTDELSRHIWAEIQKVEGKGGMIACIKDGYVQSEIDGILQQRFKKLATRADRALGTNMYPNVAETPLPREEREPVRIADTEITPLLPHRWTEQYEELRARTESFKAKTGKNLRVFLANMGPIPQHKARADFITGFMEVANFELIKNDGYPTVEKCAEAAVKSGGDIAVICSTDATYPELVPSLAKLIKAKSPSTKVFLAGAPAEEFKQSYTDAGVDDFIHVRSNCLAMLTDMQKGKGMF